MLSVSTSARFTNRPPCGIRARNWNMPAKACVSVGIGIDRKYSTKPAGEVLRTCGVTRVTPQVRSTSPAGLVEYFLSIPIPTDTHAFAGMFQFRARIPQGGRFVKRAEVETLSIGQVARVHHVGGIVR